MQAMQNLWLLGVQASEGPITAAGPRVEPTHLDERGLAHAQLHAVVRGRHPVDAHVHRWQQVLGGGGQDGAEAVGLQGSWAVGQVG